ncbi:hypothetical protein BH23PLA1_BH23PLA1_27060 [soil metagenome]
MTRIIGHDLLGNSHVFSEVRLVRQSPSDRVIAVLEAPNGSRIRSRPDMHGPEQLLVPWGTPSPSLLFGRMKIIPVKYVIGCARRGECGLSLASDASLAEA